MKKQSIFLGLIFVCHLAFSQPTIIPFSGKYSKGNDCKKAFQTKSKSNSKKITAKKSKKVEQDVKAKDRKEDVKSPAKKKEDFLKNENQLKRLRTILGALTDKYPEEDWYFVRGERLLDSTSKIKYASFVEFISAEMPHLKPNKNIAETQFGIGIFHLYAEQNLKEALEMFDSSAKNGGLKSQVILLEFYIFNDFNKGSSYISPMVEFANQKVTDKNKSLISIAQKILTNVSLMAQDTEQAKVWLEKNSEEHGDLESMHQLAEIYLKEEGDLQLEIDFPAEDKQQKIHYLFEDNNKKKKKSKIDNKKISQSIFLNKKSDQRKRLLVQKRRREATVLLTKAHLRGHKESTILLAVILYNDEKYKKSFALLKGKESANGFVEYLLATMYANGFGTKKDPSQVVSYLIKSAEKNDGLESAVMLSELYLYNREDFITISSPLETINNSFVLMNRITGITDNTLEDFKENEQVRLFINDEEIDKNRITKVEDLGIIQSSEKSFFWALEAAKMGHLQYQYKVMKKYATGTGVKRNLKKSRAWLKIILENEDLSIKEKDSIKEHYAPLLVASDSYKPIPKKLKSDKKVNQNKQIKPINLF